MISHTFRLCLCLLGAWALLPSAFATPTATAEPEPLIVSQDHAWPPFAFRGRDGEPAGLLVELWQELGLLLGRPVEFRLVDWPDTISQVREGRAEVHGGLIPSAERSEFFDFSRELLPLDTFMFVATGSLAMNLDDLRNMPIGVTAGSFEDEFMRRHHPQFTLQYFRNNELMILAARAGKIQAFVADYPVAMYLLDRHAAPADFRAMQALYTQPLVAAVRKGDSTLLASINQALDELGEDELRRMIQRWQRSEKIEVLPGWLLPSLLAGLALLLLAGYSLMLYRQRHQLTTEVSARTADLRASEEQFRVLFESASVSVMVLDRDTCEVLDANRRALESYGVRDMDQLYKQDIWNAPPYSFEDVQNWFKRVREHGPQRFEWKSRNIHGDVFWEDVNLHEVILRGVRRVVSTSIDISERKQLEDRLTTSEAKFRAFVENANDIIYSLSPTGILTYVSPNWTEILGQDTREVIGQPLVPFIHPDDIRTCNDFLDLIFQTGVKQSGVEYRIRHKNGEWRWHTSNASPQFNEQGEVIAYLGIARDITERKEIEQRITRMAHYDPLTSLPNRILFFDRVQQAINLAGRQSGHAALLAIDLDHFKPVNDTHGHAVGDSLLQQVARRMAEGLRNADTVARIGGDEFVVLLPAIENDAQATRVAKKLREQLTRPFTVEDLTLTITASIGIAIYPRHGLDITELMKNADTAMYQAKDSGRDNVRIFAADEQQGRDA